MPFKRIKRAFKKITKPVAKVLNKVVPNEIKPFLPYAAAVAPYLLPAGTAGAGLLGTMKGRAFLTGGLNLASQLAQEGNEEGDFSALSLGLAGLQGALTAPGAAETLQGMTTAGSEKFLDLGEQATAFDAAGNIDAASAALGDQAKMLADRGLLTKAADFGLGSLSKGAEAIDTIMTAGAQDPFSMAGLKAASIPFTQGSVDLGMATARKALQDYEAELAAFNAQAGANQAASDADRRAAIIASMTRADFTQDIIDETLDQLGLKDGGRVGFDNGGPIMEGIKAAYGKGMDKSIPKIKKDEDLTRDEIKRIKMAVFEVLDQTAGGDKSTLSGGFIDNFGDALEQIARPDLSAYIKDYAQGTGIFSENFIVGGKEDILTKAEGGLASLKDGGIMDLGGKEMDMRTGGFIPIGAKERADDVPARLSKNEFVMTADAVRAAGGGSVNKGAKRMYDLMHNLEARA